MKLFFSALLGICLTTLLQAQVPANEGAREVKLSRDELKELVGPIALYPDPLVALILPASTDPAEIVLAARFVASGADPASADNQPWDASVRALTRHPDTLKWLDENLDWTTQLGEAYNSQPNDVMDAVQERRQQAQSLGNLVDTPQQQVVRDDDYIRIVPANPQIIYAPVYEPEIVYDRRPVAEPYLWFNSGCAIGPWLSYDFDWHRHRLYCGDWRDDNCSWDYRQRHHYDHNGVVYINDRFSNFHVWSRDNTRHTGPSHHYAQQWNGNGSGHRLALPNSFASIARNSETIRRATAFDGRSSAKAFASRSPNFGRLDDHGGKGSDHGFKGHLVMPRTAAPNLSGDGRQHGPDNKHGDLKGIAGNNGHNPEVRRALPSRPGDLGSVGSSAQHLPHTNMPGHNAMLPGGLAKPHVDSFKPHGDVQDSHSNSTGPHGQRPDSRGNSNQPNGVMPRQHDAPQTHSLPPRMQFDAPQQHDAPKSHSPSPKAQFNAPKQHDAPQVHHSSPKAQFSAPQRHDAPKSHQSSPKAQFVAPKRHDAPHPHAQAPKQHSAPQAHAQPSKPHAAPKSHASNSDSHDKKKHKKP